MIDFYPNMKFLIYCYSDIYVGDKNCEQRSCLPLDTDFGISLKC